MKHLIKIDQDYINEYGNFPSALHLYNNVLTELSGTDLKRFTNRGSGRK